MFIFVDILQLVINKLWPFICGKIRGVSFTRRALNYYKVASYFYAKNLLYHLFEKFESYLKRVSWHEWTCRSFNSHLCCLDVRFSLREHFLFYNKFLIPVKLYLITNGKKFRFKLLFGLFIRLGYLILEIWP